MQDAETGEQVLVDTHDARFRAASRRPPTRRETGSCAARCARPASTRSSSATDDDLADAIFRFADLRKRRSQLRGRRGMPGTLE